MNNAGTIAEQFKLHHSELGDKGFINNVTQRIAAKLLVHKESIIKQQVEKVTGKKFDLSCAKHMTCNIDAKGNETYSYDGKILVTFYKDIESKLEGNILTTSNRYQLYRV